MILKPYQQKALEELRQSDDLIRTFADWEAGMGGSIVIAAHIQELRDALMNCEMALDLYGDKSKGTVIAALNEARKVLE